MQPQATLQPTPDLTLTLPESAVLTRGLTASAHSLRQISAQAVDGLFKLRIAGLEIGGVLFGEFSVDRLIIHEVRPFEPQYAYGPNFQLSPSDCARLRELIASPAADPTLHGLTAVGYYLSRTRTEPVLAEHNVQLLAECFPQPWQIALTVKPYKLRPTRCVVHYRSPSGEVLPSAEFTVDHRYAEPEDIAGSTAQPGPVATAPVIEITTAETPGPALVPALPKAGIRTRAWALAVAAVVALAVVATAYFWYIRPVAAPATVVVSPPPVPAVSQPEQSTGAPAPEADHPSAPETQAQPPQASAVTDPDAARVKELEKELAQLRTQLTQRPVSQAPPTARPAAQSLRDTAPSRSPEAASPLGAPPRVETANSNPPLPTALNAVPKPPGVVESPPTPAPSPHAVRRISAGRMLWTGNLRKSGLLFIEESGASSGAIVGALPGRPVRINVESAELTQGGIVVYTSDPKQSGTSEAPGTANGWNHTVFQYDPRRLGDLSVIEMPAARNGWKKLVVRANRPVDLIMINWQETGAEQ